MRPPQNATSTLSFPSAAARFSDKARTLTVGGIELSGMSTIVVVPPAAAAFVAVLNPSHSDLPGSLTWTCESTSPGITTRSPKSTSARPSPISTITPCSIRIDAGRTSSPKTTRVLPITDIGRRSYRLQPSFLAVPTNKAVCSVIAVA